VAVPSETEAFDFVGSPQPSRFYVVCSTPRSGSTLLTRLLWRSGRMGAPHEYFNIQTVLFRMQLRFRSDSIHAYTDELLRRRTGPNGVFGFKLHQEHWHTFWYCGRFNVFRDLKYVRIRRRDRLAQAISLAIARQTGQWTSDVPAKAEPRYDFNQTRRAMQDLDRMERGWDTELTARKVKPLELVYEDFRNDTDSGLRAVYDFVGVDPNEPATPVPLPELERQTAPINREWTDRFKQDWERHRAATAATGAAPRTP
jgi:LPS sulfotransferase NodH